MFVVVLFMYEISDVCQHVFFYIDAIAFFFQAELRCLFFRDGRKEPKFSNVINALRVFNKATTGHGKVMFHGKPKVGTCMIVFCVSFEIF